MIKITYERLNDFINTAQQWIEETEENSKFKYAVNKNLSRLVTTFKKYSEQIEDINIDLCSVDDKGNIVQSGPNGGYSFSKDNQKKRVEKIRELKKKEVEIDPYYATEVPEDLSPVVYDIFSGIAIEPKTENT